MAELMVAGPGLIMTCETCGGQTQYWPCDIKSVKRYWPNYMGGQYLDTLLMVDCADDRCKSSNVVGKK